MEHPHPREVAEPLYDRLLHDPFHVTFVGPSNQPENANWKFEIEINSYSQSLSDAFEEILDSLNVDENFTLGGRTGSFWTGITSSYIDSQFTLWISRRLIRSYTGGTGFL